MIEYCKLIVGGYNQVVKKKKTTDGKIFWYLVLSTIPAGILSLILDMIVTTPDIIKPLNKAQYKPIGLYKTLFLSKLNLLMR